MKFFKSRALYIVLLVIFTLILAATLILRFAIPSGFASGGPGGFGMPSGFSGFPGSGSEGSDDSGRSGNGGFTLPEGFDTSALPSEIDGENFPGNFNPENFGQNFNTDNMPEGFDPSSFSGNFNFPQGDSEGDQSGNPFGGFPGSRTGSRSRSSQGGFLNTVRNYWILIVSICAAVDIFCIVMLVHLTKQKKLQAKAKKDAQQMQNDEDDEPRRKKPYWVLLLIPVLIAGIILKMLPQVKEAVQSSVTVKENVLSAEASNKAISTKYLSGGSLKVQETTSFSHPGEFEIESYAVSNGDIVKEGDLIATVNKTSVLSQIKDIQDLMSDLDSELATSVKNDDTDKITAPSAGRVKAVFAEEGTALVDTMAQHGALMILSLDGLMKAEISINTGLSVGDPVIIVLSDETEVTGRVATIQNGVTTITLSDEKARYDESVTIKREDGTSICKTTLAVNSPLKITAYRGVPEKVNVDVDDKVTADKTLITLKDTEHSSDYSNLKQQRETLEKQMSQLFELYKSGEIRAEMSGEISGLPEDEEEESEESETGEIEEYVALVDLSGDDVSLQQADPGQPGDGNQPGDPSQPAPSETAAPSQPGDSAQPSDPSQPGDSAQPTNPSQPGASTPGMGGGQGGQSGMPGMPSGGTGSGYPGSGSTQQEETKKQVSYTISETELYSISPKDTMSIEISVDELDIHDLYEGQKVIVTLDALPGQSFDGEVVSLPIEGSYESGNTKFTVTISVERTEQMLSGMNAGIQIEVGETKDCMTIPVAALEEKGGKTYVYTIYDEKTDTLDGRKEVETGLSDGTDVQIVSGLSSGETVYYRYADTIEYTFNNSFKR